MTDSQRLLAEYVQTGSDAAFRELITRYVGLVYSTACRLVGGDTHRAEDVAQIVFVDLARTARTLPGDVQLGGWLHRHTCFVAAKTMRSERRRQSRERQAVEMNALQNDARADYSLVAPILDEAINELGEEDRTAILLRFFEQHDFRSVGQALGGNEDAARMRVNRALDKLQSLIKRRGVATSTTALSLVLTANAVQSAPVGLVVTISTAAALAGTTIAATATKVIAMTTLQKTLLTAALAVVVGSGIYEVRQVSTTRDEAQILKQQQALMAGQLEQMTRERDDATRQVAALRGDNERLTRNTAELLRLRGEAGVLRQQKRELEQALAVDHSRRSGPMSNLATQPARFQPFQLQLVVDEPAENTDIMTNYSGGATYHVQKGPLLDHTSLSSATVSTNALGAPQIDIEFSYTGAEQFAQITKTNINKRLAIVLDGGLYSVPVIRSEISGGKAQISGSFTPEEAKGLAAKINDAIGSR